ncbi:acyl-CoA dehydrogenase family protein [Rugosimonospora acidiphila]|uniref:Acyl-CoA dehydrogenase family protein n=1 Tax=Rugosimonospora acidiphila TaxID=556531 RepID=A0ABP9SSY0_9ACTN
MGDPLAAARRLAPRFAGRAAGYDRDGAFPVDDFADLRAEGLFGLMVPAHLGGFGAGFTDYASVAFELARGNGATALVFNMHASVTGALAGIPEEMARSLGVPDEFFAARDEILKAAARGAFYAVAMSERGAGSRLSKLSTEYVRDGDDYLIKGTKSFVSGSGQADAYLVAARSSDDPQTVSQFLVPATSPGIRIEETWDSLGMRATCSHDLHLDVRIPRTSLLGGVEGLALWFAQLMPHWLVASYAAVYVGVAQSAIEACVAHVSGRGVAELPWVRSRLGRADAAVAAARLAVEQAARMVDSDPGGQDTNRWVWRAKLLAGTTAAEVAASMLEAAGTSATRRGNPLERLYRDARCGSLQPATSDVCADWLGIAALGGDPDSDGSAPRW